MEQASKWGYNYTLCFPFVWQVILVFLLQFIFDARIQYSVAYLGVVMVEGVAGRASPATTFDRGGEG